MSTDALDIYEEHLAYELGENSPFSEEFIYEPDDEGEPIFGVFDDNSYNANKDSANVYQKVTGPRIVVSSILTFDVYEDKEIFRVRESETYTIDYVDTDENGAQVIWLKGS